MKSAADAHGLLMSIAQRVEEKPRTGGNPFQKKWPRRNRGEGNQLRPYLSEKKENYENRCNQEIRKSEVWGSMRCTEQD